MVESVIAKPITKQSEMIIPTSVFTDSHYFTQFTIIHTDEITQIAQQLFTPSTGDYGVDSPVSNTQFHDQLVNKQFEFTKLHVNCRASIIAGTTCVDVKWILFFTDLFALQQPTYMQNLLKYGPNTQLNWFVNYPVVAPNGVAYNYGFDKGTLLPTPSNEVSYLPSNKDYLPRGCVKGQVKNLSNVGETTGMDAVFSSKKVPHGKFRSPGVLVLATILYPKESPYGDTINGPNNPHGHVNGVIKLTFDINGKLFCT